jgi:hypothetical protein
MIVDSEKRLQEILEANPEIKAEWKENHKLQNDPRITVIGKFLRRTSIDELSQLINIWKGEMSLVGPRPIVDAEVEKFKEIGVAVYTLGIGKSGDLIPLENKSDGENFYKDREGSLIKTGQNEGLLKELADKTGGFYTDITNSFSGINRIINIIEGKDKIYYGSKMVKEKIDRTYIFLLILIIILGIEMFINERKNTL